MGRIGLNFPQDLGERHIRMHGPSLGDAARRHVVAAPLGDQLLRYHRVHPLLKHAVVLPAIRW